VPVHVFIQQVAQDAPPSLRTKHLFDERYVLIGRRKHPRLRKGITVEEFARLEHVIVSLGGGGFVTRWIALWPPLP
jgi:DNA-binding transcriptional LysR family regulator